MAINLVKGQTIDLRKNDKGETFDLSKVTIGLGWDMKKPEGGFFKRMFAATEDYDLDAIAFLLDNNGKVANLGRTVQAQGRQVILVDSDVIFFNNLKHPSGQIWLTGDNRTGAGDGDDEQIIVNLDRLDAKYDKILFMVCIYMGGQKNQHFGGIQNAYMRAVDARGKEIAKFSLSNDATFNNMRTMMFGELYRKGSEWKFRAIGDPKPEDNFIETLRQYAYV